jgi:hypothetical protein
MSYTPRIQVGSLLPKDQQEGNKKRTKKYSYIHVETDERGWADAKKYLPVPFDLVYVDDGEKIVTGWWSGTFWDGLRLKKDTKVIKWKRERDYI